MLRSLSRKRSTVNQDKQLSIAPVDGLYGYPAHCPQFHWCSLRGTRTVRVLADRHLERAVGADSVGIGLPGMSFHEC